MAVAVEAAACAFCCWVRSQPAETREPLHKVQALQGISECASVPCRKSAARLASSPCRTVAPSTAIRAMSSSPTLTSQPTEVFVFSTGNWFRTYRLPQPPDCSVVSAEPNATPPLPPAHVLVVSRPSSTASQRKQSPSAFVPASCTSTIALLRFWP